MSTCIRIEVDFYNKEKRKKKTTIIKYSNDTTTVVQWVIHNHSENRDIISIITEHPSKRLIILLLKYLSVMRLSLIMNKGVFIANSTKEVGV